MVLMCLSLTERTQVFSQWFFLGTSCLNLEMKEAENLSCGSARNATAHLTKLSQNHFVIYFLCAWAGNR